VAEPEEGTPAPSSSGTRLAVRLIIGGVVVLVLVGRLAADHGFFGLPSTFVIDGSQRIRVRFTGYVTARDLREILDEFLAKAPG
jgi:hypothetical protein